MRRNNIGLIVGVLIIVIVLLLGIILYAFLIKPSIAGYTVGLQNQGINQGVEAAVVTIMQQAATCQQVPITFENQTMNLIWVDCLQVSPQQPVG